MTLIKPRADYSPFFAIKIPETQYLLYLVSKHIYIVTFQTVCLDIFSCSCAVTVFTKDKLGKKWGFVGGF
jgi:hypothetical protein